MLYKGNHWTHLLATCIPCIILQWRPVVPIYNIYVHVYIQYILPYSPASRFECVKVSKEIMKLCKGDFDYKCTSEFIMKYAKFSIVSIKRKHCKIVNTNNNSPSSTRELWDKNCIFCELHLFFTIFVSVQYHRGGIVHFSEYLLTVLFYFSVWNLDILFWAKVLLSLNFTFSQLDVFLFIGNIQW